MFTLRITEHAHKKEGPFCEILQNGMEVVGAIYSTLRGIKVVSVRYLANNAEKKVVIDRSGSRPIPAILVNFID
ncbi:hypothetical protein HY250_03595 [Candidatus Azambacteria bacterium]|nr:hypothetical protein [Candidatus Azambacteria bacterium]MBI3685460.1 hypothetical protein [Candidatus Azambacteria bacterium]